MFKIILSNQAKKDLRKVNKIFQIKIEHSIDLLYTNPFLGEKMSGDFYGSYRIKIPPLRIIYTPDFKNKIITIRAIGHRQGIYKS